MSKELRLFEITADGIVVGERLGNYQGLLTGSPRRVSSDAPPPHGASSAHEAKS